MQISVFQSIFNAKQFWIKFGRIASVIQCFWISMKHLRNHFALPIYEQRNLMHNAYHFGWISYFNSEIQRNASVVQFFSLQIALHFKVALTWVWAWVRFTANFSSSCSSSERVLARRGGFWKMHISLFRSASASMLGSSILICNFASNRLWWLFHERHTWLPSPRGHSSVATWSALGRGFSRVSNLASAACTLSSALIWSRLCLFGIACLVWFARCVAFLLSERAWRA